MIILDGYGYFSQYEIFQVNETSRFCNFISGSFPQTSILLNRLFSYLVSKKMQPFMSMSDKIQDQSKLLLTTLLNLIPWQNWI